jgi:hypothetical protein
LIDILLLVKNKNCPLLVLQNFFFLYIDYSIIIGSYFLDNNIPNVNLYHTLQGNIYNVGLNILLIFDIIRYCLFRRKLYFNPPILRNNPLLFYVLFITLIYICIFEVNRDMSYSYEVKIKPLYEYSTIFFALCIYYSGKSNIKKILLFILAAIFVLQDAYYGGRATSLQIILLFAIFYFYNKISIKNVLLIIIPCLIVVGLISSYRVAYQFDGGISDIFKIISKSYFVQDTATYAYFASMTQVYASYSIDFIEKLSSFGAFILSVLFGSYISVFGIDPKIANPTQIANDIHWNAGGGLMPTTFFFWFGYVGTILLTFFTFRLFRSLLERAKVIKPFPTLVCIIITIMSPRWILYSPLPFFRGPFVIFPIIYFICNYFDKAKLKKHL